MATATNRRPSFLTDLGQRAGILVSGTKQGAADVRDEINTGLEDLRRGYQQGTGYVEALSGKPSTLVVPSARAAVPGSTTPRVAQTGPGQMAPAATATGPGQMATPVAASDMLSIRKPGQGYGYMGQPLREGVQTTVDPTTGNVRQFNSVRGSMQYAGREMMPPAQNVASDRAGFVAAIPDAAGQEIARNAAPGLRGMILPGRGYAMAENVAPAQERKGYYGSLSEQYGEMTRAQAKDLQSSLAKGKRLLDANPNSTEPEAVTYKSHQAFLRGMEAQRGQRISEQRGYGQFAGGEDAARGRMEQVAGTAALRSPMGRRREATLRLEESGRTNAAANRENALSLAKINADTAQAKGAYEGATATIPGYMRSLQEGVQADERMQATAKKRQSERLTNSVSQMMLSPEDAKAVDGQVQNMDWNQSRFVPVLVEAINNYAGIDDVQRSKVFQAIAPHVQILTQELSQLGDDQAIPVLGGVIDDLVANPSKARAKFDAYRKTAYPKLNSQR